MRYARLKTLLTDDMDYCFCGPIENAESCDIGLSKGDRVGTSYPRDPFSVKVRLDPDFPGLKLPSILGNTRKLLALSSEAAALFEKHLELGEHESFPFTLVNHKGRVHSKDYVFLNPIGSFDVADPSSDFLRFPSGGIYGCRKWVLKASKLKGLPDILRPRESPVYYLASERVVALVKEHRLTNFQLEALAHV
jgi:hypothetical protein